MSSRVATSCSSTQLASTPSSGAGSSIGRWVWLPLFGMIVRYCPASSPNRVMHPPDEVDPVARQHPEVIARPVVVSAGSAISTCRVDRSDGLVSSRLTDQLAVAEHPRGPRPGTT